MDVWDDYYCYQSQIVKPGSGKGKCKTSSQGVLKKTKMTFGC